ncbi:MAG TPA: EAL domain-containing protein [Methylophilaceae bacterium]|nr:EAL domain-containing protein [Methylophilaceae bacterium]
MPISWDLFLVAISFAVAIVGSFTALTHVQRMRANLAGASRVWMITGAITLGLTIWSMHFIGMLAFQLPIPLSYDPYLTILSVLPAIAAALIVFFVLHSPTLNPYRLIMAGSIMGLGISTMHYTGMAALKMSPAIHYSPGTFALSILTAAVAASGALLLIGRGDHLRRSFLRLGLGGIVMGLAISGMHYIAMLGSQIVPGSVCLAGPARIDRNLLAAMVSIISTLWFFGGILAALFDKHISKLNSAAESMAYSMTRELREKEEKLRAVVDAALDCIITINGEGNITEFNRAAEETFGYCSDEVIGRNLAEVIIPPAYRERHLAGMAHFMGTGESRILGKRLELTAIRADGSEFPVELTITKLNREGPPLLTGFLRDITDRKKAEDEIHSLAFFDPLTRLPNRRLMRDRLQHALTSYTRRRHHGAILFIDLDNFKTLNDTRGHGIGDLLLIEVASRLQTCIRTDDTVTRLGGDEFVVLLENLNEEAHFAATEAELVGEKICQTLNQPYMLNGFEYHNTCSIGIGLFHDASVSVDELLKRADTAMYEAKRAGRNTVRFFDPAMQALLEDRTGLESDLRHALRDGQFVLYFQRQVDDAYRVISAEVLLRWQHPERGLVSPAQFIPVAEETSLILPIGQWVLESACQQLKAWENDPRTRALELAVNVSARQFRQSGFVEQVRRVLERTGAAPAKLKLELTESLVLDNIEDSIRKMEALRAIGIRFSVDDFGTGHSSLTYLKRLPLSQLKIDQSFVQDIAQDANDAVIVQTIIGMARNLGLAVIAEGVETSEQLGYLQNYGCPAFQGYLFGKPMPYEEFIQALETRNTGIYSESSAGA